ncbi:MAG: DUF3857 domain-containing protein, partial [Verrucomicrobiae bacterium]|nr:DUF3857 domain-containing protein [Verrucomicrobiae bacterium]
MDRRRICTPFPVFQICLAGWLVIVSARAAETPVAERSDAPAEVTTRSEKTSAHSAAEPFFSLAPASPWVKPLEPDLKSPAPFQGPSKPGVYFRLVDYQVNADTSEEYYHFASEFLTPAGVHDDSDFDIEFDPSYQQLEIHRIRLLRGDEIIDILDPEMIRVTVPEDERIDGLLDGHVTALVLMEDVRPGDVVEYDYTLKGANPVFDGVFFDSIPMEWETTVRAIGYRLLRDASRAPLKHRNHGVTIEPTIRKMPGGTWEEWTWQRENIPPRLVEDALPGWYSPFAYIELSEFEDWGAVARWGARHYDFTHLPSDPELSKKVETIRRDYESTAEQAMAAIHFVQDEIRYLGLEDGVNAFRPVQPGLCFRRRFGDCKDKTVLLGQMLAELGIESDPVCVAHARKHAVDDLLPSPMAFDHVVLRIRMPSGEFVWCDATDSHQGGTVDTLAFPDYERGL